MPGHPGLVSGVLQSTGNPVIVMLEPDKVTTQEIKVGSKAKIMDMVAIRHASATNQVEEKTTMILLCEDGNLNIYMAEPEKWYRQVWITTKSFIFKYYICNASILGLSTKCVRDCR